MDYSAPLYENISIENEEMNSSQWTQFMQLPKEAWKKKRKKIQDWIFFFRLLYAIAQIAFTATIISSFSFHFRS